jgi:flagellar biosynthetic protein FliR
MNSFDSVAGIGVLLVRPGMLVVATPFLGLVGAPAMLRVGLTVLIAILLAPVVQVPAVTSASMLAGVIAREVAIGLAIAFAIRILVFGAEFAGHFAGYSVGLSMGSLIDPQSGVRNSTLAILYGNVAVLAIFATNAHHFLLQAVVSSYAALPIGVGAGVSASLGGQVATMLGLVFVIGVRIAAPVVIVLLVLEVAFGLVARVAPALNVMMAGAPIRLAIGLLVVAASISVVPELIRRYVPTVLTVGADTAQAFR